MILDFGHDLLSDLDTFILRCRRVPKLRKAGADLSHSPSNIEA